MYLFVLLLMLTFSIVYISMQFSSTRRRADVCSVGDVNSSCLQLQIYSFDRIKNYLKLCLILNFFFLSPFYTRSKPCWLGREQLQSRLLYAWTIEDSPSRMATKFTALFHDWSIIRVT